MHTRNQTLTGTRRGLFARLLLPFLLLTAALGLAGCADNTETGSEGDGELVIGLTDAEGDFATYTVDVKSLTLTKASGEVVEALPLTTRVDFAQYTEMTEFLTAASVSSGLYTQASMVLDYSGADIQVEDANGDAVPVTTIVDADGNPITELEVAVKLEGRNALRIVPGVPAHLTLDFDLKASNSVAVDDQGAPIQVTVEPFLLAELDMEKFKTHRLRGPLAGVDVGASRFEVIVRPFHHVLHNNDHHRRFGTLTVTTTDSTVYDISGEGYEGQAGLVALDAQPAFTAIVVIGDLKLNPRRFEAREVYAGSSVPGGTLDVVTGNVIARQGDTLTVKGATLIRQGGSVVFNDKVTVQLGDMTTVKRQLDLGSDYTIGDISVGQRVRIFGTLTADNATQLEMDAGLTSEGRVQMRFTTLRGTVVGMNVIQIVPAPEVPLVLKLQAIDGRRVSLFDFTGTGSDPAHDADPARYEIDTGSLDVSSLGDGTPVKVRGFVRPFGQAPADFTAQTVMDVSQMRGNMVVGWDPASNGAIESLSADGMTLNLDGVGKFHHLARGRVAVDLTTLGQAPSIVPRNAGEGLFWIAQGGTVQLHTTFAGFAGDLDARLSQGLGVKHVAANGVFDDDTARMTAGMVSVSLK